MYLWISNFLKQAVKQMNLKGKPKLRRPKLYLLYVTQIFYEFLDGQRLVDFVWVSDEDYYY